MKEKISIEERLRGVLIGTAVGDSLGLPAEGLRPDTIERLGWTSWRHRFLFGRGMISDDTEHTCFCAEGLLRESNNPLRFQKILAWKLRFWLLGLPAGIGMATGKAIIKLWSGIPPNHSGVYSAGNGPAMRSALFGVYFATDKNAQTEFVKASTGITHTDSKALVGALAVSSICSLVIKYNNSFDLLSENLFPCLRSLFEADENWLEIVDKMEEALQKKSSVKEFAATMNLNKGITGYTYHTVPIAIYSNLIHFGNYEKTLIAVLNCGGDTDTVGAIAGAIAGTIAGERGIPTEWINGIWEWPRSVNYLRALAKQLWESLTTPKNATRPIRNVSLLWSLILVRNLLFLIIVLVHGFLRLLPCTIRRRIWRK